jgi:hypothetical protein
MKQAFPPKGLVLSSSLPATSLCLVSVVILSHSNVHLLESSVRAYNQVWWTTQSVPSVSSFCPSATFLIWSNFFMSLAIGGGVVVDRATTVAAAA